MNGAHLRRRVLCRILAAAGLAFMLPVGSVEASPPSAGPQVSIDAISGDNGHAFVYARVIDRVGSYPAPPGSSPTPYYSRWQAVPVLAPGCPWVWAVFVYERATNRQLNAPPPGAPAPNFRTTTFFCATPRVSPVMAPRLLIAQARLDLDLAAAVTPTVPAAGAPARLSARLSSAVSDDLGLLLSMALDDWQVSGWQVAFGDGEQLTLAGGSDHISAVHIYPSAILYEARIKASITGMAQAADYGPSGSPFLIRVPFGVDVGRDLPVVVSGAPPLAYVAPAVSATVSPTLDGLGSPAAPGEHRIDVPRGVLVDAYVRPTIDREGYRTIAGRFADWGQSNLVSWRYAGSPGRPPDRVFPPEEWRQPADPLRLAWDSPDALNGAASQDYAVRVLLRVRTRYRDGRLLTWDVPALFLVTVRYAAQNE
ncbi:MAG TPA: hypothetical protein VET65_08880 [Candidatus Limnocylindrales bacterium]|nr:hypothetical protein [Candidatus Limnocylindrales bacterium]